MPKRLEAEILREEAKLREDIQRIHNSYKETDKEFNKWKKEVLRFEYTEHCADGDSDGDDRVRNWKRVWTAKDENDPE